MNNTPCEELRKVRAVVLDFDGVLAESVNGDPVLYALRKGDPNRAPPHMRPLFEIAKHRRNDGASLISMLEEAGMDVSDRDLILEISAYISWNTRNDYIAFSWIGIFIPMLATHVKMALCSNNTLRTIRHVLGPLLDHFMSIRAFEDVTKLKPHPEGLRSISDQLGIEPSEMLLVGDTIGDMISALTAGTHFGLATWGRKQVPWLKQFLNPNYAGCCDESIIFQISDPRKLLAIVAQNDQVP